MTHTKSMLGILTAACFLLSPPLASAADTVLEKGAKPEASPGWIIIEEDFYSPWFYAPLESYHAARLHFQAREEKAAATELKKAESWLRAAAGNAQPKTKKALQEAAVDLHKLALDLEKGNIVHAKSLDTAMASASQALAEWHFYKAKASMGRADSRIAARHLSSAARHLDAVANSIHYDNRSMSLEYYDDVNGIETVIYTDGNFSKQRLEKNVKGLEAEIQKMSAVLKKASV